MPRTILDGRDVMFVASSRELQRGLQGREVAPNALDLAGDCVALNHQLCSSLPEFNDEVRSCLIFSRLALFLAAAPSFHELRKPSSVQQG